MTRKRIITVAAMLAGLVCAAIVALAMVLPSGVTRANFSRLQNGMTPAEVEEVFGESSEEWIFNGSHRAEDNPLMWVGDGTARIMFDQQGGLVYKIWSEEGFSSPTKEAFARIQVGMTLADVEKAMGRTPDRSVGYHGPGKVSPMQVGVAWWIDIDGEGAIEFDDFERVKKTFWGHRGPPEEQSAARFQRVWHLLHLQ